jgi:hypothetical protein
MGCGCRGGGPKKNGPRRIGKPMGPITSLPNRGLNANQVQPLNPNTENSPIVPIRSFNPNSTTDRERIERLRKEALDRVQGRRIF